MKRVPQGPAEIRTFSLKVNGRQRDAWVAAAGAAALSPHGLALRSLRRVIEPPGAVVIGTGTGPSYRLEVETAPGRVRIVERGSLVYEAGTWAAVLRHFRGLPVEVFLPFELPPRRL